MKILLAALLLFISLTCFVIGGISPMILWAMDTDYTKEFKLTLRYILVPILLYCLGFISGYIAEVLI